MAVEIDSVGFDYWQIGTVSTSDDALGMKVFVTEAWKVCKRLESIWYPPVTRFMQENASTLTSLGRLDSIVEYLQIKDRGVLVSLR